MNAQTLETAQRARERHKKRVGSYRGNVRWTSPYFGEHNPKHVAAIAEVIEGMSIDEIAHWIEDIIDQSGGWMDDEIDAIEREEVAEAQVSP